MVGPIPGKTLVIGGRLGLLRELFFLHHGKQVADKGVCLVAVPGEVEGYADTCQVKHVIVYFPHVFIGGLPLSVPVEGFVFQPSRVFGPGSDNGTDTGRLQRCLQLLCSQAPGIFIKCVFFSVVFYKLVY